MRSNGTVRFSMILVLLAGCAAPPSDVAPLQPGDQARLQERLRIALESPSVLARFYAEYEVDNRVKATCRGTSRGFRSGIVLVEEESKGGPPRRILRVGDRAWIFEDGWKDATGAGLEDLGAGFQNPYEVLSVLERASERFLPAPRGGMACPDMRNMRFLGPLTDRSDSSPPATASIDGQLKSGFRDGPLITRFSVSNGSSGFWLAKVDIVWWGPAPPMTFDDIPAPFTPDMKAAVRKATEGK